MNIIEEFRLFVVIEEFTGILLKYMYINVTYSVNLLTIIVKSIIKINYIKYKIYFLILLIKLQLEDKNITIKNQL